MNYYVYMLLTKRDGKFFSYVGYTNNLERRLNLHNTGKGAKFTRGRRWKIIYSERYATQNKAKSRECYIKKNRKLRNLIKKKYR